MLTWHNDKFKALSQFPSAYREWARNASSSSNQGEHRILCQHLHGDGLLADIRTRYQPYTWTVQQEGRHTLPRHPPNLRSDCLVLLTSYSSLRTLAAARWTMSFQYSQSQIACSTLSIDMSVQSVMLLIQERGGLPRRLLPGIVPVIMSPFSSSSFQNTAAFSLPEPVYRVVVCHNLFVVFHHSSSFLPKKFP